MKIAYFDNESDDAALLPLIKKLRGAQNEGFVYAASGTNLKSYIEALLEKEANPMTRNIRRNSERTTNRVIEGLE